ncbi:SDR family oxidoreductase [Parapedomonas caeni]
MWFVTGASSGLGQALARRLLAGGARVIVSARDPAAIAPLAAAYPEQALALRLDIRDEAMVADAVAAGLARFGTIDVLVNNAAFGLFGAVEEVTEAQARAVFDTNFFGTLRMIRHVLPVMRARAAGRIINISSAVARFGVGGLGLYAASKCAIEGLSTALVGELAPLGIHVMVAEPGALATAFGANMAHADSLPAYGFIRERWAQWLDQALLGDLDRAAAAIVEAGLMSAPPATLVLGQDALQLVRGKLEADLAECLRWTPLTLSITPGAQA